MAINLKLPKSNKPKKIKKGNIPTKNYINVMIRTKQPFNLKKNLPVLIIVGVLLLVACKFLVFDRIMSVSEGTDKINSLKTELADTNRQISEKSDMEEMYAHYTTSGMTEEELSQVDRIRVMKLVDKAFKGGIQARTWNLTGNIMTLEVTGPTLSRLNDLASELEQNQIVEKCVISSANKGEEQKGKVSATFTIYLKQFGQDDNGGDK